MLTQAFLAVMSQWQSSFHSHPIWQRAILHAVTLTMMLGRGTITNLLRAAGRTTIDWNADYRFYSHRVWTPESLFDVLLLETLPWQPPDYVVVGLDDTGVRKTGKQIPFTSYQRDPLSPPFRVNLCRQLRFVHAVALVPWYQQPGGTAARAIPVRWVCAPPVKKPKATASDDDRQAYRQAKAAQGLPAVGLRTLLEIRHTLNTAGQTRRTLLAVVDGSYCNRTLFRTPHPGLEILARCRKDLKLCHRAPAGSRRVYAPETFTPEAVRQDPSISWQEATFWYGGAQRSIRYKEVPDALWQSGALRRGLRLIVLAATPYRRRKHSKLNYREPAYLLTTDVQAPVTALIQHYLDRWQIEVAHREEKTMMRVGQAQVWHPQAVARQPAFTVAVYGALLVAALHAMPGERGPEAPPPPAWYDGGPRASIEDLQRQLRAEVLEHPELLAEFGVHYDAKTLVLAAAA